MTHQNEKKHKNILVVCQHYYPENFQITPICEQMVEDGYNVTILTGLPNYPLGVVPDEYKKGHRDEVINGVHVVRGYEIGRRKGPIWLAINYASFTLSFLYKVRKLPDDFDMVLVYQLSPVLMALPGIKYANKHKVPLMVYCCDLWPESMKMYIKNEKNILFKIMKRLSKKVYSRADVLAVQSKSFIGYMEQTHGIKRDKMVYMPAFADESYLYKDFTSDDNVIDFVFLGNLGIAQNLRSVLEAVNKIKNIPGFKVHFIGDGSCLGQMKDFVKENGLEDKVQFYGRRPVEEMPKFYKLADACLVSLKSDNATGLTLPSKVQGYMAAGLPIIGMINGSAKDVIEEANCGICVNADDIAGMAYAMKEFINNPHKYAECGENGRKYFKENFSKEKLLFNLENHIDEMLNV